jgi:hypothetical protein
MEKIESVIKVIVGLSIIVLCLSAAFYFWTMTQRDKWVYGLDGKIRTNVFSGEVQTLADYGTSLDLELSRDGWWKFSSKPAPSPSPATSKN